MAQQATPEYTFKLLTYNINDEATSESAPPGWTLETQHDLIRALVLRCRPDLLCLQECFTFPSRLRDEYDFHGEARSHRGSCCIATRKGGPLKATGPAQAVGPAVLLPLTFGDRPLLAASAHLAPFHEFGPVRARQVAAIVEAAPSDMPLVLAGDMNMREPETPVAATHGLMDAWLEAGSPASARWSWNTKVNRYYTEGHAYTARYDRVLYRGCRVCSFGLAADEPCSGVQSHFLSDHFALVASLRLM